MIVASVSILLVCIILGCDLFHIPNNFLPGGRFFFQDHQFKILSLSQYCILCMVLIVQLTRDKTIEYSSLVCHSDVGSDDGSSDGEDEGSPVGFTFGSPVGFEVGSDVGSEKGRAVGSSEGVPVGIEVGSSVEQNVIISGSKGGVTTTILEVE